MAFSLGFKIGTKNLIHGSKLINIIKFIDIYHLEGIHLSTMQVVNSMNTVK